MAQNARRINTAEDIKQLGTILSVWAHPDDESFLAAGLIATATVNGQTVICVTATKGEAGSHDEAKWPTATLGRVRAAELKKALKILGVTQHHWLGYIDGHCHEVPLKEGIVHVKHFIERYHPDTIITFGPHGSTGHTDHISVSKWVKGAVSHMTHPPVVYHAADTKEQYDKYFKQIDEKINIYFNIDEPPLVPASTCDIVFKLSPAACRKKCLALEAQPSQTETMVKLFGRDFLLDALAVEAFVKAR